MKPSSDRRRSILQDLKSAQVIDVFRRPSFLRRLLGTFAAPAPEPLKRSPAPAPAAAPRDADRHA
ncbi:hypothetical protein [Opitutus sp. ER46]|uniref:hypothetical protein n=1 Tax=Opitutus sp. ER46 TaxID=2161864 RepID=UPI000D3142EA|nr:hypothetical protein [Opitutus sp. ER46]PTX90945.1 hypothetical protein DB354_20050 [Opitutus sp. ER46]